MYYATRKSSVRGELGVKSDCPKCKFFEAIEIIKYSLKKSQNVIS